MSDSPPLPANYSPSSIREILGLSATDRHQILEFALIFLLLLPFYLFLLPASGGIQWLGFALFGTLTVYALFFSPHRLGTPEATASRKEVFFILIWSLGILWGVVPFQPWGTLMGKILLTATACYVLFISPWRHGDSAHEWGLSSPREVLLYLRSGEHRQLVRTFLILGNLLLVYLSFTHPEWLHEFLARTLRRMGGIRLATDTSPVLISLASVGLWNLLFFGATRWDNLPQAARLIGAYLLVGWMFIWLAGGWYIFVINGGWVELNPANGLKGVGSYVLWGTLQELLFLSYFNTRIRKGFSSPLLAALLTAMIFSIFHLRAYTLMGICFIVGIIWALIFQAAPNLLLLGIAHGISGGFGAMFVVKGMTMVKLKMSVGPFH